MRLDYLFQHYWPTEHAAGGQGEERRSGRRSFVRSIPYLRCCPINQQIFVFVTYFLMLMISASYSAGASASANTKLVEYRNVFFDRIGTADGLSSGQVAAITQDSYGFIWN